MDWAAKEVEGLEGQTVEQVEAIAPLSLVRAETGRARSLLGATPLYLGLESVSIPGLMEVTPGNVEEIVEIGAEAGVQGFVLSWDLLHTPIENVRPFPRSYCVGPHPGRGDAAGDPEGGPPRTREAARTRGLVPGSAGG